MLRLSALFMTLSIFTTLFLSYELGLLGFTRGVASEGPETTTSESGAEVGADGIESLNRSLSERAKVLDEKEADITRRERTLKDKEVVFSQQLDRYEKIIQELKTKIAKLESLNVSKVEAYQKLYEKMDPKKVAQIFEEMDPYLVSEILIALKPQTSVEILAKMPNKHVRLLTEKFLIKRMPAANSLKASTP